MMNDEKAAAQAGHAADLRERQADERDRVASDREALADERERRADERERHADERERHADERQREADQRERDVDVRLRGAGVGAATLHQRTLEAIDRARELLVLSAARLDRQAASVKRWQGADSRDRARQAREQEEVDRASAEAGRALAALPPDPGRPLQQAGASRQRAVRAIRDLATNYDEVARAYTELAAITPGRREEYQACAEKAREAARKARQALRTLTE
jgi:hypothetical protein